MFNIEQLPLFHLGAVVQHRILGRVVPIISAKVSWLMFGE
jgi:hypothetical protein